MVKHEASFLVPLLNPFPPPQSHLSLSQSPSVLAMIKRRHFRQDHGEEGSSSSSSDSSADLDPISDASSEEEEELNESAHSEQINGKEGESDSAEESEGEEKEEAGKGEEAALLSPDSDYDSEESSDNDYEDNYLVDTKEEEKEIKKPGKTTKGQDGKIEKIKENGGNESVLDSCIFKFKAVFKCKLCPKIVILSEKIVKQHLESKRHKRSKKLFEAGRLKVMINSDGELEEDVETHAERYARTLALAEEEPRVAKKDSGRQRQRIRSKKKRSRKGTEKNAEQEIGNSNKKKQQKKSEQEIGNSNKKKQEKNAEQEIGNSNKKKQEKKSEQETGNLNTKKQEKKSEQVIGNSNKKKQEKKSAQEIGNSNKKKQKTGN